MLELRSNLHHLKGYCSNVSRPNLMGVIFLKGRDVDSLIKEIEVAMLEMMSDFSKYLNLDIDSLSKSELRIDSTQISSLKLIGGVINDQKQ